MGLCVAKIVLLTVFSIHHCVDFYAVTCHNLQMYLVIIISQLFINTSTKFNNFFIPQVASYYILYISVVCTPDNSKHKVICIYIYIHTHIDIFDFN